MDKEWVLVVVGAIGAICVVVLLVTTATNFGTFPGVRAEIEAVRSAVSILGESSISEDVLGQAVEMNRKIATHNEYGRLWWCGWLIPNGWHEIAPIELPGCKEE